MPNHIKIGLSISQAVVLLKKSNCYNIMKLSSQLEATVSHMGRDK